MGKLTSYRDLEAWQVAIDLVEAVYRLSELFPERERFTLTVQLRRAALSVPSNIAEGYGRATRPDYLRHLAIANGSLKEVETQMIIAGRLGYVNREQTQHAWHLAQSCGRLLNRLIASLS